MIKCDGDVPNHGSVVNDSLIPVGLAGMMVCVTELGLWVFSLLMFVFLVDVYDSLDAIGDAKNFIDDRLSLFVVDGNNDDVHDTPLNVNNSVEVSASNLEVFWDVTADTGDLEYSF